MSENEEGRKGGRREGMSERESGMAHRGAEFIEDSDELVGGSGHHIQQSQKILLQWNKRRTYTIKTAVWLW